MAQKRPKPRKCLKCGKVSRTKGNICLNKECGEPLPPFITRIDNNPEEQADTATTDANQTNGGKKNPMKTLLNIIGIALLIFLVLAVATGGLWSLGNNLFGWNRAIVAPPIETTSDDDQKIVSPTPPPATPSPTPAASIEVFSLGKPADPNTIDPYIWNKPWEKAVMIDANGTTVYTQSGKDNSVLLKGQVPAGQSLILDSFSLSKETNGQLESYSGGNILVIVGPIDLDTNPISYTDGAAQMIGTIELQEFLDGNIAVKFARGDWDYQKGQWSYKPWALANIWLPKDYTFKKLVLTYDTDIYPNKDTAPIITNTK